MSLCDAQCEICDHKQLVDSYEGWQCANCEQQYAYDEGHCIILSEAQLDLLRAPKTDQPVECREAFEKFCDLNDIYRGRHKEWHDQYELQETQLRWMGFQAAWQSRPMRESGNDAELMEEYERAKEEAVETCMGSHNSYGCGYDSGYREGIRWAIYRGEADGK